jgi:hypothetical protein
LDWAGAGFQQSGKSLEEEEEKIIPRRFGDASRKSICNFRTNPLPFFTERGPAGTLHPNQKPTGGK